MQDDERIRETWGNEPCVPLEEIETQFDKEMGEEIKRIEKILWSAGYNGFEVMHDGGGLIFIFNKDKTKALQMKWLKQYCETLNKHGIKAEVSDQPATALDERPCICI